jgi:hypothetical protein
LSRGVQVIGATWRAAARIMAGVGDLVRRTYVRSAPCIRRQAARVFWFGLKSKGDGFSRFGLKTGGFRFPGLVLKTDSYGLVISDSKSPQRFHGLSLKIK